VRIKAAIFTKSVSPLVWSNASPSELLTDSAPVQLRAGIAQPGSGWACMAVTVEIKTGSRTVISYLLSPLLRYKHESLRER
jgi:hypothetical protein